MFRKMNPCSVVALTLVFPLVAGCGTADTEASQTDVVSSRQAISAEDALGVAFGRFKSEFMGLGRHRSFDVGLAPFDALGTENLGRAGLVLDMEFSGETATGNFDVRLGDIFEIPPEIELELWAGRNEPGAGRSIRPETGDAFTLLGTLSAGDRAFQSAGVNWNDTGTIDFLALTRAGVHPSQGVVAMANLTLFERRFFAEQFGWILPVPAGVPSAAVPTNDPRVQRGFQVFFEETFDGNGRTCGSCHRAENNFTIDGPFLATLSPSDPLFQAALDVPGLEGLPGDPLGLMLANDLILENVDGFAQTPVFRSVQHLFGLTATTTRPRVSILGPEIPDNPPDERLGWSGDGSPGRGTLHDFAVGAIVQHLPADLERRVDVDFRLPTQEELDSLEAFQLSLGRSADVQTRALVFADAAAEAGKTLFNGQGLCFVCHDNGGARSSSSLIFNNFDVDSGVERRPETLALGLSADGGFGSEPHPAGGFGNGQFNVQTLIEAADTAPFFHNNSAATLEDAVRHYTTEAFDEQRGGFAEGVRPQLDEQQIADVAAFLRVLNAVENTRQVRQRLEYVRDNGQSPANAQLLELALADVDDALEVLEQPGRTLSAATKNALLTVRQIIQLTQAQPPSGQSAYASVGVTWCQVAINQALVSNPNQEFLTD